MGAPFFSPEARAELSALIRLALPLIAAYCGLQAMSVVDAAMVGRLGAAALGGVGIGNAIFFSIGIVGMGCVLGMDPLCAQAIGAGERAAARRILWQGVRVALTCSVPTTLLTLLSSLLLRHIGIDPQTVHEAERFLWSRAPNMVPFLLFVAARSYLQTQHIVRPIVIAALIGNVANFIGNALLIYGDRALRDVGLPAMGLPGLGVIGSGLSSSLASGVMLLVLVHAIRKIPTPVDPQRRSRQPAVLRSMWRIGLPLGMQLLAEVGLFGLASVLAGRMGQVPVAAHQIAITLASCTFIVTVGIASATSVRVGFHVGQGDHVAARRGGVIGMMAGATFMTITALAFLGAPQVLARALTNDAATVLAATPLVMIAAVFQLSDGIQSVAAGALRGAGDTRIPMIMTLVGYYGIGLPVCLGLGYGLHLGAPGLWWGLCAGLTIVAVLLSTRFRKLSSRPIERAHQPHAGLA
jgi:MATE family multidrug resistance protein